MRFSQVRSMVIDYQAPVIDYQLLETPVIDYQTPVIDYQASESAQRLVFSAFNAPQRLSTDLFFKEAINTRLGALNNIFWTSNYQL
jgi:hypothetical protein